MGEQSERTGGENETVCWASWMEVVDGARSLALALYCERIAYACAPPDHYPARQSARPENIRAANFGGWPAIWVTDLLSLPNAAAKIWTVLNYGITFYAGLCIAKVSNYDA